MPVLGRCVKDPGKETEAQNMDKAGSWTAREVEDEEGHKRDVDI